MEIWQLYLVGYGVALLCWLMIIAFTLLISIFSKRNLLLGFGALTGIIAVLLGLAAGIGDLIFVIWLFQNNQKIIHPHISAILYQSSPLIVLQQRETW